MVAFIFGSVPGTCAKIKVFDYGNVWQYTVCDFR